jgi:hypothetical protein
LIAIFAVLGRVGIPVCGSAVIDVATIAEWMMSGSGRIQRAIKRQEPLPFTSIPIVTTGV